MESKKCITKVTSGHVIVLATGIFYDIAGRPVIVGQIWIFWVKSNRDVVLVILKKKFWRINKHFDVENCKTVLSESNKFQTKFSQFSQKW